MVREGPRAETGSSSSLQLKADDFNTLDMLKQLCFRLRDEPGIQEKYDKYFPLWKAAKGE